MANYRPTTSLIVTGFALRGRGVRAFDSIFSDTMQWGLLFTIEVGWGLYGGQTASVLVHQPIH